MTDDLVFKTGLVKRALGWFVFLGAAAAMAAMIVAVAPRWNQQTSADLWSGLVLLIFLLSLMLTGVAIQFMHWSIRGDTIILRRLFETRRASVSEVAGFGKSMIVASVFPLAYIDLYDSGLAPVLRLPVQLKDRSRAEAWFSKRLRYVVNDGSAALPKRRFAE